MAVIKVVLTVLTEETFERLLFKRGVQGEGMKKGFRRQV